MSLENTAKRKLSKYLAFLGIFLLASVYFLGGWHPSFDNEDNPNLSFQPLSIFVPEDAYVMETQGELEYVFGVNYKKHFAVEPVIYDYEPQGILSALGGYYMMPIWSISLQAPQYPDGLIMYLNMTHYQGDVPEINILNHYIGMAYMETGGFYARKFIPFLFLLFIGMIGVYAISEKGGKWNYVLAFLPSLMPVYFIIMYRYYQYVFGYNLDEGAPLKLEPFVSNLFGITHIGQFTTYSQPVVGFWFLVLVFIVLNASIFLRMQASKRDVIKG